MVGRLLFFWNASFRECISTALYAHNIFQNPEPCLKEGCDIIAYSTAISACEKAYQWQAAMSLLFNTLLAKMKMDLIAYSATISACEKCQQWQYALLLFHEIKAASHVDLITYNSVISACENAGKWQEALELLFEAEDISLKTTTMTYNVAISACEKAHMWEAQLELNTLTLFLAAKSDNLSQQCPFFSLMSMLVFFWGGDIVLVLFFFFLTVFCWVIFFSQ